jgi:hypothetical protein
MGILTAIVIGKIRRLRGIAVGRLSEAKLRKALNYPKILATLEFGGKHADARLGLGSETVLRGPTGPHGGLCARCGAAARRVLESDGRSVVGARLSPAFGKREAVLLVCPHQRLPRLQERIKRLESANVRPVGIVVCRRREVSWRDR